MSQKQERELYLSSTSLEKDLSFIDLDKVNELTNKADYLICSCKDPDKLGVPELESIKIVLQNESMVFSYWESPSRDGLKGIVFINHNFDFFNRFKLI